MSVKNHICIADKADCCGCTACYAICPHDAITMQAGAEGFQYPAVDEKKCVNCGLCIKTCPIRTGNQNEKTDSFYAVKHLQEEIRENSSSGGAFTAFAQTVLEHDGVIYGAAFDENFTVKHIRAEDQSWTALRTAKYVQSDMGDIFQRVKADLKDGREVLFSGTPCQIDGLRNYLKRVDTTRLITVDLICHGVPSPSIWRDYLSYISGNDPQSVGKINFRNKKGCGWHNSTVKITGTDGSVLVNQSQSQALFYKLFLNHVILRPSCFACQYANLKRAGDITIGDYWGVEKYHPELDDDRGISLVMINTPKGHRFLQNVKNCQVVPVAEEECMQPNLKAPAEDFGEQDVFWRTYRKYGFAAACKRMGYLEKNLPDKLLVLYLKVRDKLVCVLRK